MNNRGRHFIDLAQLPPQTLREILTDAAERKARLKQGHRDSSFQGRTLAMIFDKPSTRTRVSFDVAMRQLGGETIMLAGNDMQLGSGETIADTARVLSRYVDIIMIRTTSHDRLLELSEYATVPVVNGLTDDTHPCQIMADMLTYEEHRGPVKDRLFAWTGDGNNVLHSLIEASACFGFRLNIAVPAGSEPEVRFVNWSRTNGGRIEFMRTAAEAVKEADCVVTDTWVSMGQETQMKDCSVYHPYQVNEDLMSHAKPDALFMHCLPAHRGDEVTDAVMDGPQSVVFDEAENRLHAQKAVLAWCLGGN